SAGQELLPDHAAGLRSRTYSPPYPLGECTALCASQSVPNSKPIYWLTGARLASFKGSPAALVAYETPTEKISLLISCSRSAVVAGGEEVRSGGFTFHYRSGTDSQVVTWTNHGLTYALVSSLTGSPQRSCLVCHQDMPDQNLFKH